MGSNLLDVRDLAVTFSTQDGLVRAVRGVSFAVEAGQTLGIVGESGSGKSVTMLTVLGLTRGARISGEAYFEDQDLLRLADRDLRHIRGAQISMIFQDPLTSLHPAYRVGWQIAEVIRTHEGVSARQARARAVDLLRLVGIPRPEHRVDDFPHEFSGGMRQRAMIAMAVALSPKLLIADEPTTALDVTVQAQILDLLQRLQREFGTAVILITHDLGVVADVANDVLVMYAGKLVETADRHAIYYQPHHPYALGLLGSVPSRTQPGQRLYSIPGQPPSLINIPSGCPFHPRCPYVMDMCVDEEPPLRPVGGAAHSSACWLADDLVGVGDGVTERREAESAAHRRVPRGSSAGASDEPSVETRSSRGEVGR